MTSPTVQSSIKELEVSLAELKKAESKLNVLHASDIDKASKLIRNLVKDTTMNPNTPFITTL